MIKKSDILSVEYEDTLKEKMNMFAVIQNVSVGEIIVPEFKLRLGEVAKVPYTTRLQEYVARKLIKIIKIVNE